MLPCNTQVLVYSFILIWCKGNPIQNLCNLILNLVQLISGQWILTCFTT
jgi:hypothetical protein